MRTDIVTAIPALKSIGEVSNFILDSNFSDSLVQGFRPFSALLKRFRAFVLTT